MKIFLLSLFISCSSQASLGFRCESLFSPILMSQGQVDRALDKLARFWLDIVAESNPAQKKILREEFEPKMVEFMSLSRQGPAEARSSFEHALKKARALTKNGEVAEKQREFDEKRSLEAETEALDDLKIWQGVLTLKPFGRHLVGNLELTPDGDKLIVGTDFLGPQKQVQIFDLKTLKPFDIKIHGDIRQDQRPVSADGSTWFINMGQNKFKLIDLKTMTELPAPRPPIEKNRVMDEAALSADGTFLFYGTKGNSSADHIFHVYNLKTKRRVATPHIELQPFDKMHISMDGKKIFGQRSFFGGDTTPLWGFDLDTNKEISFPIDFTAFSGVTVIPSSDQRSLNIVASGHSDMYIFDLQTKATKRIQLPEAMQTAEPIRQTPWLILSSPSAVTIFDPTTGRSAPLIHADAGTIGPIPNYPQAAITPDLEHLFVAFGTQYHLFDTSFTEADLVPANLGKITDLYASGDGSKFIALNQKHEVVIWFRYPREARKFPDARMEVQ